MSKDKIKGAKQRIAQFVSKQDGTYDAETGEPIDYTDGYQISFVRPHAAKDLSDEQWDEITNYLSEKYRSKEHVGVYEGTAETSFRITSLADAKELMYIFNQDSVLNWEKKHPLDDLDWKIARQAFIWNESSRQEVNYDEILR